MVNNFGGDAVASDRASGGQSPLLARLIQIKPETDLVNKVKEDDKI